MKIDYTRNDLFSEQGKDLLSRYYKRDGDNPQDVLARAAKCFSFGDEGLAQRIYDAVSQQWFFYSSPILSNASEGEWVPERWATDPHVDWAHRFCWRGEVPKAMPIACFLSYLPDTISGQVETMGEIANLSVIGGGTSIHSRIRSVSDKAPGPIPYFKTMDGILGYYRQGKTRRGSTAIYMDVSHPEIEEFIKMRRPSGGDQARKIENRAGVHHAVNVTQEFIESVVSDGWFNLVDPHTKELKEVVKARDIWDEILESRILTGEPYIYFIDVANAAMPQAQRDEGLKSYGSNLCAEITLATNEERTAVCCLSSLNMEKWEEWKDTNIVQDLVRFLDNVLEWFMRFAPQELNKAAYSAEQERAIGIGAMGWHNLLMSKMIPFESGGFQSASQLNNQIFKHIKEKALEETKVLAKERGEPRDLIGTGLRNSHLLAIAPNANSAVLCNTSPAIEPIASNAFTQKSRAGVSLFKNKYLDKYIRENTNLDGEEYEAFWKDVIKNQGSVQHIEWLPEDVKKVFKTSWEIDQHWVVEQAGQRQKYICQSQSLNLFFPPKSDKKYINSVHLKAAKEGLVKSLYYFRTGSESKADTVKTIQRNALSSSSLGDEQETCISCQ